MEASEVVRVLGLQEDGVEEMFATTHGITSLIMGDDSVLIVTNWGHPWLPRLPGWDEVSETVKRVQGLGLDWEPDSVIAFMAPGSKEARNVGIFWNSPGKWPAFVTPCG